MVKFKVIKFDFEPHAESTWHLEIDKKIVKCRDISTAKEEHEKLAELLLNYNFDCILLMGPRMSKYAYPKLETLSSHFSPLGTQVIERFLNPTEVLKYLQANIQGEETILFKGARFLEGVIEHLLANKEDAKRLCRQEKVWKIRRRQWGL